MNNYSNPLHLLFHFTVLRLVSIEQLAADRVAAERPEANARQSVSESRSRVG